MSGIHDGFPEYADLAKWPFALNHVTRLNDLIAAGDPKEDLTVDERYGIDPLAVRACVAKYAESDMTPLPHYEAIDDVGPFYEEDDMLYANCPVWTEDGPSGLVLDCRVIRTDGLFCLAYVQNVLAEDGHPLLTAADAPFALRRTPMAPLVGHGGDARINQAAYVGTDSGVLLNQIYAGLRRAVGDPIHAHLDELNPGQQAMYIIEHCFLDIYDGGLTEMYSSPNGDLADKLVASVRLLGAEEIADTLQRANDYFPADVLPDQGERLKYLHGRERDANQYFAPFEIVLRERDDAHVLHPWDIMLDYIEENPHEFFRD